MSKADPAGGYTMNDGPEGYVPHAFEKAGSGGLAAYLGGVPFVGCDGRPADEEMGSLPVAHVLLQECGADALIAHRPVRAGDIAREGVNDLQRVWVAAGEVA